MPGARPRPRNGSQKWGGHQANGRSHPEDHWGDNGTYGFRGGRGTPRELRAAIERADEGNAEESLAAAAPVTLFVRNFAGRTWTVRFDLLRGTVAELEDAIRLKEPGIHEMRVCVVGGAPLSRARGASLAECGVRENSSL